MLIGSGEPTDVVGQFVYAWSIDVMPLQFNTIIIIINVSLITETNLLLPFIQWKIKLRNDSYSL